LFFEAWQRRQRLLGPEDPDTLQALQQYGVTLYQTAHLTEAEQIARYLLHIRERTRGLDHADTLDALISLSACVGLRGDQAQDEALIREIIRRCEGSGTNKEVYFLEAKELAHRRTLQGDPAEADRLLSDAIPLAASEFGPAHLFTLHGQRVLARALADEG